MELTTFAARQARKAGQARQGQREDDFGMRIAECRRHRAEGIGKDDRGQRERSRRSEVRDQRTEGRL